MRAFGGLGASTRGILLQRLSRGPHGFFRQNKWTSLAPLKSPLMSLDGTAGDTTAGAKAKAARLAYWCSGRPADQ